MKRGWIPTLLTLLLAGSVVQAGGEIYGTIHTSEGRTLTGPIRWDTNENFWDDHLDATKRERIEREEDGFQISIFGLKLGGGDSYISHSFSISFGHLKSIERLQHREARVTLKSGEQFDVRADSSDLGHGMRGLIIDDAKEGRVELNWSSFDKVEFKQSPGGKRDAERLYGTVDSDAGEFSGFIVWDRDESMLEDILDGEDERGRDHEVPFRDIAEIERLGSGASRVTLRSGDSMVLDGTNDVAHGHRGVGVTVSNLSVLDFNWRDVRKVSFSEAPASPRYEGFDGGRKLSGTVHTRDGATHRGEIIWDRDETYTWENLDGDVDDLDYSIPFSSVESVKPLDSRSSEVKLRNGKTLTMSGSNDVDSDNMGLVVTAKDGTVTELTWADLRLVEFD